MPRSQILGHSNHFNAAAYDNEREPNKRKIEIAANFLNLEKRSFSVFVDNFSQRMTLHWLWEIFTKEGHVVDVYLSRKIRKNSILRFAFVRYQFKNHAQRAIDNLNGLNIDNIPISVAEAKKKKEKKKGAEETWERNVKEKSFKSVLMGEVGDEQDISHEEGPERNSQSSMGEIMGEVDRGWMEKLQKSSIDESSFLLDLEDLRENLFHDWDALREVKGIGRFKALMVFESVESRDEAMQSYFLLNRFAEVRECQVQDMSNSRRTWIEIYGMPLHGWNEDNLRKIAELSGVVVRFDACSMYGDELTAVRALIDTP
ncbi:hypothetical protein PIB30_004397 [Stylosanthes scabra]|uniref:RRM domain-containing protein n=1 Tax=Stylosanthes scabra TaxID=79078 RepID=A0ABU6V501_9FABA|nr:hypothetical protein [Stylosanthes scabra]